MATYGTGQAWYTPPNLTAQPRTDITNPFSFPTGPTLESGPLLQRLTQNRLGLNGTPFALGPGNGMAYSQAAPGEVTTEIPGVDPLKFGQPTLANSPWLAPQAKTGTGQSGQEQVENAPVAPMGQGGDHPTLALFTPSASRTRTSGQQEVAPGETSDWRFINGRLHFRISTHPENPQMTVMRHAIGHMKGGMTPEAAYRKALAAIIGSINELGAADNTFTLYDYSPLVGEMMQHWSQQGYFERNAWDEAWKDGKSGRFMNAMNGAGHGLVTIDQNGGLWDPTGKGQIDTNSGGGGNGGGGNGGGGNGGGGNGNTGGGGTVADPVDNAGDRNARQYGAVTLDNPLTTATALAGDPTMAARFLRQAQGLSGPTYSRMGKLRDQLYGRMLSAYLNLSGQGGNTALQPDDLANFFNASQGGANNLLANIQGQARNAMSGDLNLPDDEFEQLAGYAAALAGVGRGSVAQSGLDFNLSNLLTEQMDEDIRGGGKDTSPLYKRYAGANGFRTMLERYLAQVGAK